MTGDFAALVDVGVRRSANQDEALALRRADGSVLLLVADGAGGMGGGDVASAETRRAVSEVCEREGDPAELLAQAAELANERVRAIAARDYPLIGSASTLVAAIVTGGRAWLLSIGDSRGYLAANGELRQVTEDDSWVAEQVRAGLLGPDEARVHPRRNVITRAIGTEEALNRQPVELELPPASTLLLCSDGLSGAVDDGTIARLLAEGTAAEAAKALVDEANSRGGPDNIAVALYREPGA